MRCTSTSEVPARHGEEARTAAFLAGTGIAAYRRDVVDFAACASSMAEVEASFGPIDSGEQRRHRAVMRGGTG